MKILVSSLLLLTISSNQVMAGRGPSLLKKGSTLLKEMKTPSSFFYHPPVSRCLVLAGAGCMALSVALIPVGAIFPGLSMGGVGATTAFTGLSVYLGGLVYGNYARNNRVTEGEEIGAQVRYLDKGVVASVVREGEVVATNAYGRKLFVEWHGKSPVSFKMRKGWGWKENHHVYQPVEVLAEVGKEGTSHHVGYVVGVLDDGFYELELIAEVDASVIDLDDPHKSYLDQAIKPYRVFIDEKVAFEDGGFRFNNQVVGVVYENLFNTLFTKYKH